MAAETYFLSQTSLYEEDYNEYKQNHNYLRNLIKLVNGEYICEVDRDRDNCLNTVYHNTNEYLRRACVLDNRDRAIVIISAYKYFFADAIKKFLAGALKTQYTTQNYIKINNLHYDYYVRKMNFDELEGRYWDIDSNMIHVFISLCNAIAASYIKMRRLHTTMTGAEFMRYTNGELLDVIIERKIKECGDYDKIL